MKPLNLFYEEPDPDRWIKFDRYPRRLIRRIVRGKPRPGGVMMIALQLMKGLDKLGVPYRLNDYRYIRRHPDEIACIIGKPQVLAEHRWKNPIIVGAGIFSHPVDDPHLLEKYPGIKKILVPGAWMKAFFDPVYGEDKVAYWPAGIDTAQWSPAIKNNPSANRLLIYDKVRWDHEQYETTLIQPLIAELEARNLEVDHIRYGSYTPAVLTEKLSTAAAVIFLCEHETQGLAYQQILATGTPILAWDRGGFWQDPSYFPHRVTAGPVSSVPYWDDRCGMKFTGATDFPAALSAFMDKLHHNGFSPREYILENLTLEKSATSYLAIYNEVLNSI